MKKMVIAGFMMMMANLGLAQEFKKGEQVEFNRNLSDEGEFNWSNGDVVEVDKDKKQYAVKANGRIFTIPFDKENRWMRKGLQPLKTSARSELTEGCTPTADLLKRKIQEEFDNDFSEYDSVRISYNSVEALESYINKVAGFGKVDAAVYPFKVDFMVRLVSINSDGTQRVMNWQFKRKYLLYQNALGKCSLVEAEKEEEYVSFI